MTIKKQITHIDCFSGVGGVCTGFKAAGIKTVLAIEKVQGCVDTYKANHPEIPVICKDIRKVTSKEVKKFVKENVDIVTSGMPCETFSTAGSKSRSFYDDRQLLFTEAIRIAKTVNAQLILFENVPAITSKKIQKNGKKLIIDEICTRLSKAGYKYQASVILNAAEFGVPQTRKRFFLLATKNPKLDLHTPVSKHKEQVTVKMALEGLDESLNNENKISNYLPKENEYVKILKNNKIWKLKSTKNITYHIPPKHRPCTLERFKMIEQGEGLKDLFEKYSKEEITEFQKKRILPKKWYIQRNRRLMSNKPAITITSHCLDETVHPTLNRGLTVREVARLQSFPDSYDFVGGPMVCPHLSEEQDKYEQIGDAVPPILAYNWALNISKILQN